MTERFRKHLAVSGLVPEGCTVLLGYSGGADSTCLLHLLREVGVDVIAAHLHHGQRQEADKEQELCEATCKSLDVPFMSGKADVPRIAKEMGIGLEEAGRHARYEFFDQCLYRTEADLIATAHTLDDRVETVLLNLARGTGLHGLAGIQARRGNIVRPLLPFTREETRAYCTERGLWFHDDPANDDESFARVRVRKLILPELESINTSSKSNIARLAQLAEDEDRFLDGMAAAALERAEHPLNGLLGFVSRDCEAAFDKVLLLALPKVLLARAVRLVTGAVGKGFDSHQTETVIKGLVTDAKGSVTAEGGTVVFEWDESRIHVRSLSVDSPYRFSITLPGETLSDDFGWKITAQNTGPDDYRREPGSLDVVLSAEAIKGPLYFRSYESGDTLQPLGRHGTRKLSEVFSDMGITEAARKRIPVVCDLVGPVWVPGGPIAERVKVTPATQRCIRLAFGPV